MKRGRFNGPDDPLPISSDIEDSETGHTDISDLGTSKSPPQPSSVHHNVIDISSEDEAQVQDTSTAKLIDLTTAVTRTEATRIVDIDSEEENDVDQSLANIDEYTMHKYVGSFPTKIVGIQHYRGDVTTGESVSIIYHISVL